MTDVWVSLARWFCRLPLSWQMVAGRVLGRLFIWFPNQRKEIARRNIAHCFPQLTVKQKKQLLKNNLIATGQGVSEMMAALWCDDKKVRGSFEIVGLDVLQSYINQGQGVLLLSCHTTSIEWGIRGLNYLLKQQGLPVGHMLAREHNNKKLEAYYQEARLAFVEKVIDKKDIRSMLKSLKSGNSVYYAPDQNFSYQCEFVDFFDQPAATTTGPAKLTHTAGLIAVPWFCFRTGLSQWRIEICHPLSSMGKSDYLVALKEMNQLFENKISEYPDQYLWVHRRFKNQPDGADIYR